VTFGVGYAETEAENEGDYPSLDETLVVGVEVFGDVRAGCFYPRQITGIQFVIILQVDVDYQVQQIQQNENSGEYNSFLLFGFLVFFYVGFLFEQLVNQFFVTVEKKDYEDWAVSPTEEDLVETVHPEVDSRETDCEEEKAEKRVVCPKIFYIVVLLIALVKLIRSKIILVISIGLLSFLKFVNSFQEKLIIKVIVKNNCSKSMSTGISEFGLALPSLHPIANPKRPVIRIRIFQQSIGKHQPSHINQKSNRPDPIDFQEKIKRCEPAHPAAGAQLRKGQQEVFCERAGGELQPGGQVRVQRE
jgi:hypothetical protein